jgi:hypothetical protein
MIVAPFVSGGGFPVRKSSVRIPGRWGRMSVANTVRPAASVQAMTQELHAIYIWMGRMDTRVRNLEDQPER